MGIYLRALIVPMPHSNGRGNHFNGLEGFWGFLKRKLVSKGGIREKELPLYFGEHV